MATPPGPYQSEEGTVVPEEPVRIEGSSPQRVENDNPNVLVYRDMSSVSNFCGILQPPFVDGNSPPGNVDMLPGRPEIVPHDVTHRFDMDMSRSIDCTLAPADLTQGDVTICNSSVIEISSLGVDTTPRRRVVELSSTNDEDDRRDEAEVDEESEPSSQLRRSSLPCVKPKMGQ